MDLLVQPLKIAQMSLEMSMYIPILDLIEVVEAKAYMLGLVVENI